MARIQMLQDVIATYTKINDKRSGAFFKELEIVKYIEGPPLITNFVVITKERLNIELSVIKSSWESYFDDLVEFMEEEIKL
jgi:hypothetical protein